MHDKRAHSHQHSGTTRAREATQSGVLAHLRMPERGVSTSSNLSIPVLCIASCRIAKYNERGHESPRASLKLQRMCKRRSLSTQASGVRARHLLVSLQYGNLQNCRFQPQLWFKRGVEFMLCSWESAPTSAVDCHQQQRYTAWVWLGDHVDCLTEEITIERVKW